MAILAIDGIYPDASGNRGAICTFVDPVGRVNAYVFAAEGTGPGVGGNVLLEDLFDGDPPSPGEFGPRGMSNVGSWVWLHTESGPVAAVITKQEQVPGTPPFDDGYTAVNLFVLRPGGVGEGFHDCEHLEGVPWKLDYPRVGQAGPIGVPVYAPPATPKPDNCKWVSKGSVWDHTGVECIDGHVCDNSDLPALPDNRYPPGTEFYLGCTAPGM